MSESNTCTAPARGLKAGKLFMREEQKDTHAIARKEQSPFFSGIVSKKSEAEEDAVDIQALFIPGIHLQREPEEIQKCDCCAEQMQQETKPDIQRCENCDAEIAPVQPSLKIGAPDDPYEREADRMADRISLMPLHNFTAGGGISSDAKPANVQRNEEVFTMPDGVQRSADGSMHTSNSFTSKLQSGDPGAPISSPVRQGMESAFQADFSSVRIHTGTEAASMSGEIGAQAFAYQNHIYFNDNKYDPQSASGRHLLAHELTHTVQQGAAPVKRDTEEDSAPKEPSWFDKLKAGLESVLRTMIPSFIFDIYQKIKKGGLINYIKEIVSGLFRSLFQKIGFSDKEIDTIIKIFASLKDQMPAIIDGLSKNDCKPLFAALNLLSQVMGEIAGRVWDKLMAAIEPVRKWLKEIWDTYVSPAIDKITAFAGEAWEQIKRFGRWLWDKFYEFIIKPYKDAWDWVSEKLGLNSDEPGFLDYVSKKLGEAWDAIKEELRPVIEPIEQVIEGIKNLVNLDAIRKLQEDAKLWLDEVAKTATAMGSDEDAVANKQLTLREVLLPALRNVINKLKATILSAGAWVVEKVTNVTGNISGFVTGIQTNTYLSPIYSPVSWIPKLVDNFRDWATDKVNALFNWIASGVEKLKAFIEPVVSMLVKVVDVVGNIVGKLPEFILGVPFMFLPKCIKDPIIKWLTDVILRKIPIIAEFLEVADKWEQIKAAALGTIKQIFVDGQLGKGLWTFFRTLLDLLGIDPTLVTTVIAKAAQNFSNIISHPKEFFSNVWAVIKGGFKLFWDNILDHLPKGALQWLFGEVKGAVKVKPPKDFSIGSLLSYVMDVFGITKENVYARMAKNPRIGPKRVDQIRKLENALTGALEWITVWIKEGADGLLRKLKEKFDDLKNMIINGIVSWITTQITAEIMKRLATSSDPLGIGATINTIKLVYDTIKTAIAYVNRMLNIANKAMDDLAKIIAGDIEPAQKGFEELLAAALPTVIGFSVEVIIGNVGDSIKEIIEDGRKFVDDVIDSLINAAVDLVDSIINGAKAVAGTVLGWLGLTKEFTADDGEPHKLSFAGTETYAKLMVASEPQPFNTWIATVKIDNPSSPTGKKMATNKDKAIAKNREMETVKQKKETERYTASDKEKEVKALLDELSELLGPLFGGKLADCASEANSKLSFGGEVNGYGSLMEANGLTKKKMPIGSVPDVAEPETFRIINQRRSGVGSGSYYVLGHLLNHNLGGTGKEMKNLTPLTRSANGTHHSLVESSIKTAITNGNSIEYKVKPTYGSRSVTGLTKAVDTSSVQDKEEIKNIIREEAKVPTGLDCTANFINPDDGTTTAIFQKTIPNTLDQRPEAYDLTGKKRADVYLDCGDANLIAAIEPPMTPALAAKIVEAVEHRKEEDDKRFASFAQLRDYQIDSKNVFNAKDKMALDQLAPLKYVKLYS